MPAHRARPPRGARLLAAISAADVYLSDDAGDTWRPSNSGIVAAFLPGAPTPEFGQCVHKVARDAGDPERLYLQHHDGIYRSDDGGGSWAPMQSIGGVDFGFPVVAHPTRPGTAYLLPLVGAEYRCTPDGHCTVWRTGDAGGSWSPLTKGLPQTDAHLTVLRDGFTTDGDQPAGLYFGTRGGEVYSSADDGDSWQLAAALERRIRDEQGRVRVHVNLFVGAENVRGLAGVATELRAGDEVSILAAISGG